MNEKFRDCQLDKHGAFRMQKIDITRNGCWHFKSRTAPLQIYHSMRSVHREYAKGALMPIGQAALCV